MSINENTRWELLASLMADGFFIIEDFRFIYVNQSFENLVGATPGSLIGRKFEDFVHPDQRDRVVENYTRRTAGDTVPEHYEVLLLQADGKSTMSVWMEVRTVKEADNDMLVAGSIRNIESLKQLKKQLADTEIQLNSILNNMSDTIYQTNMEGLVTEISESVVALLGYSPDEVIGQKLADFYWTPEERQKVVQAIIDHRGKVTNVEAILRCKDGTPVWISTNAYVRTSSDGEPVAIEGIARDVSRQKELEQKLEKLALTDSLTGLPNRRALMDELNYKFYDASTKGVPLCLIYFDVNEFKKVNDHHGHLIGDNLLRHIAFTMRNHVTDSMIFGRLSGDEFLFILPGFEEEQASKFAYSLYQDISKKPLVMQDGNINLSLAIGVSCYLPSDKNEYSLLDRADKAMYKSKEESKPYEVL